MDQYLNAWILGARLLDLLHVKAHVRGTVALPKNNPGTLDLFVGAIRGHRVFGIPHKHLRFGNAVFQRGIAPQVLIREEEDALPSHECPVDDGRRI